MSNTKSHEHQNAAANTNDIPLGVDLPTVDHVIDAADAQRRTIEMAAKEAGIGFWNQKAPFMEQTTRGELATNVAIGVGVGFAAYGVYRLVRDVFFAEEGDLVNGLTDAMSGGRL
jgi:hypothetical protein